jgi:hypothetical protein
VEGSCEHGNEPSCSIKFLEVLDLNKPNLRHLIASPICHSQIISTFLHSTLPRQLKCASLDNPASQYIPSVIHLPLRI